eukprot:scaffold10997_cov19-Tisochrysis_lutea.AAC.1
MAPPVRAARPSRWRGLHQIGLYHRASHPGCAGADANVGGGNEGGWACRGIGVLVVLAQFYALQMQAMSSEPSVAIARFDFTYGDM